MIDVTFLATLSSLATTVTHLPVLVATAVLLMFAAVLYNEHTMRPLRRAEAIAFQRSGTVRFIRQVYRNPNPSRRLVARAEAATKILATFMRRLNVSPDELGCKPSELALCGTVLHPELVTPDPNPELAITDLLPLPDYTHLAVSCDMPPIPVDAHIITRVA